MKNGTKRKPSKHYPKENPRSINQERKVKKNTCLKCLTCTNPKTKSPRNLRKCYKTLNIKHRNLASDTQTEPRTQNPVKVLERLQKP